jgi:hypothetical protein
MDIEKANKNPGLQAQKCTSLSAANSDLTKICYLKALWWAILPHDEHINEKNEAYLILFK